MGSPCVVSDFFALIVKVFFTVTDFAVVGSAGADFVTTGTVADGATGVVVTGEVEMQAIDPSEVVVDPAGHAVWVTAPA